MQVLDGVRRRPARNTLVRAFREASASLARWSSDTIAACGKVDAQPPLSADELRRSPTGDRATQGAGDGELVGDADRRRWCGQDAPADRSGEPLDRRISRREVTAFCVADGRRADSVRQG